MDHQTLRKSGPLPLAFLRGVGLPDNFIDYLSSLLNQSIQHYSCFISYSAKDDDFAKRIHADLQNHGVRCWFAPHDLRIGDKILDDIDVAIGCATSCCCMSGSIQAVARACAAEGCEYQMSGRDQYSILDAIREPRLFGPAFKDLSTWRSWLAFSSAVFCVAHERSRGGSLACL
jgi:hypothetical protein